MSILQHKQTRIFIAISTLVLSLFGLLQFSHTSIITQAQSAPQTSWSAANYQGMGFVTGLYFHPNEQNLIYSRTDVGGTYRWNQTNQNWISLSDATPLEDKESYNVESFALDSNPQNAYMVTGSYQDTDPTKIDGKLWKSTNKGDTWTKIRILDGQNNPVRVNGNHEKYRGGGERLAVVNNSPSTMYYGSRYNGLLKSINAGTSWVNLSLPATPTDGSGVAWVVIDPTNPQDIYISIPDQGIFKSTTGGMSWSKLDGLTSLGYPYRVQLIAQDLYVSFTDVSSAKAGGLWKYNGTTWSEISPLTGKAVTGFAVDPTTPQKIYADTYDINDYGNQYDTSLYQTNNGGANWFKVNRSFSFPKWFDNRSPHNNQYDPTQAIGINDFFLSTVNLDPFNTKKLWFATGWGVFGANDISQPQPRFTTIMKGLEELVINQVVKVPGGKLMAPTWDMGMIVSNNDTELPLLQVGTADYINNITNVDYSESNKQIYAAVGSDQNWGSIRGEALKSTDGGLSWTEMSRPGGAFGGNIAIDSANPQNMVWVARVGNGDSNWNGTAFRTTDGGINWSPISSIPQGNMLQVFSTEGLTLAADRKLGGTFYTFQCSPSTGWSPNFYRSTDAGQTFTQTNQSYDGTPCAGLVNLKVNPEKAGQLWYSSINGGDSASRILRVSPDGGVNWKTVSGITDVRQFGFGKAKPGNPNSNTTLFVFGRVNGVYGMYMSDTVTGDTTQTNWQNISGSKTFSNSSSVSGDLDVYGKVYVGMGGKGVRVGTVTAPIVVPPTSTVIRASDVSSPSCTPNTVLIGNTFTCSVSFSAGKSGTITFDTYNGVSCVSPQIAITDISTTCSTVVNTFPGTRNISYKGSGDPSWFSGKILGLITVAPVVTKDTTPPVMTINDPYSCGGDIRGTVIDPSGIASIKITMTLQSSSIYQKRFDVQARADGVYVLPIQSTDLSKGYYVAPGSYLISYIATDKAGNSTPPKSYLANVRSC
jgi:hypothetical protein